uniref:lysozyme inhibitor LprI family protein n=1 Tax=Pseudomonas sp. TaxID=306 RepID=UPI001163D172|nr:lysozyme inhibitor LprI family protein [Pseudomonas sp.]QDK64895.1 hypothetical protein pA62H2_p45 [Pseudomonas sp.]
MHRYVTTTTLLIAFLSPYAFAESDYSPVYTACVSSAGGVTSNLSDCGDAELAKQDARLNKAYKFAMTVLPAENKRKLRDAQVLWVKFRDADCGMNYSLTGGTMDILNGSGCELSMTRERADSLEWFAEMGAEGVEQGGETDAW